MTEQTVVILKRGREKSLLRHHPWIFSGAIQQIKGTVHPGTTVAVMDMEHRHYGWGAYSPSSQIAIRMWSFDPQNNIDDNYFRSMIRRARDKRTPAPDEKGVSNMQRLIFSESDNLPGLIVDRYADYLVVQFLSTGADYHKDQIVAVLHDLYPDFNIYERSDEEVRNKEGLSLNAGVLIGKPPPLLLPVTEGDCQFWVDIQHGHKTGFYIDQSTNRQKIRKYVRGKEVLNCFSYTGGFAVAALKAEAQRVINIESSAVLLDILQKNLELNRLDISRSENITGDVFQVLRQFRDSERQFDVIILDPPRFADSRRHIPKAARGYKDINWLACRLIKPGGILITFSCSGAIKTDLFQKIVADAAQDAQRSVQMIQCLTQAVDHPVVLHFPESAYLKGLICRVW